MAWDAPAWGRGAGRGAHLDGAGRPCSRLPPALRQPGLATWEPAPRGLAATLSWERRPRRHHEEVLLRWAPRPAWGGSATGTCANHPSASGRSGRGHQGTKWVRWPRPRRALYPQDSLEPPSQMGIVGTLHIGALPSPVLGFPYAQTCVPRAWRRRIFKTLVLDAVVSLDLDLGSPFAVPRRPSSLWSVRGCSEGILLALSVECLTYRWCLTCLAAVCVGGVGWRGLCLNLSAWWTRPRHFLGGGRYL